MSLSTLKDLLLVAASYAIGCLSAGYYLVKLLKDRDVRQEGSGSTGALNASRILGSSALAPMALLDGLKGAIAVWLGRAYASTEWVIVACILAAVCGHIWPIQLRFRGGKGMASAVGALIIYDPQLALYSAVAFALIYLVLKNVTLSGLAAVSVSPLLALGIGRSVQEFVLTAALSGLLIVTHRMNLREEFVKFRPSQKENIS